MSKVIIDVRNIRTVRALHIYLDYCLDLPAHYGRNLDALYDMLREESRMLCLCIAGADAVQGELAAYMPRLMRVMQDAAQENERLTIERV